MPGLAFFEGSNLERRVRRLLAPGHDAAPVRFPFTAAAVVVGACLLAVSDAGGAWLHMLIEGAVRLVP
jgi:hypothetical protein